ncbi:MAG TPA: glycosyltransferase, partial [Acidimicrobiales bacterium]|nr:glycosyltransferase [Acidimicrobiales bacterium]
MTTVALVAAKDASSSIAATVEALRGLRGVGEVWVVDDGSTDDTATRAAARGAHLIRLEVNRGKGGALAAGLAATPHADRYLLADADLGATAAGLAPLLDVDAAFVVGVLPSAGGRGGFGTVKRLAAAGIRRATGVTVTAPLSGQRVVDGPSLRSLVLARRFGVEVGMTIDLVRAGIALHEVAVDVEHHHRGRSVGGFVHRARQGVDIGAALTTRLWTQRQRVLAVVLAGITAFAALSAIAYVRRPPAGVAIPTTSRVVLFAYDGLRLSDLDAAARPALRAVAERGAVGALSVRTSDRRSLSRRSNSDRPAPADAYASLGASARVRAGADMVASRSLARRDHADSLPGALGDALRAAGKRATVLTTDRAAGLAVADRTGHVDHGADGAVVFEAPTADPDAALARAVQRLSAHELLVVFSPTPPGKDWELTPIVLVGDGIAHGSIQSATTHRAALAGLVDIAPTVLRALAIEPPASMTGAALRVSTHPARLAPYERLEVDGAARNRFFLPASIAYTVAAIVFYLALLAALRWDGAHRWRGVLRLGACVAAAFPFALLVTGAIQHWLRFGGESPPLLVAVTVGLGVAAARLRGLAPVYALALACLVVISLDVAATGPLHAASLLGYTIQTTGRYYGLPNASFSIYASSLFLVAGALAGWQPTPTSASAAATVMAVG